MIEKIKNKLDENYLNLLEDILTNGIKKEDRTGTGTLSVFGRNIKVNMRENNFPLLTTKKMYTKGILVELLWFLNGETNIKYLVDNDCNIWTGDAFKKYQTITSEDPKNNAYKTIEEFSNAIKTDKIFAEVWGDLGPIYGKQWRDWDANGTKGFDIAKGEYFIGNESIDQIYNLIYDLQVNPDSRRLMVNAWNVAEIPYMTLPPCHYGFQCYTRLLTYEERYSIWMSNNYETGFEFANKDEVVDFDNKYWVPTPSRELSLMWNQRSVDTLLGLPFNIASYGFLLSMIAQQVNMTCGDLIGSLGDTHLYLNHIDAAKLQLENKGFELPSLKLNKAKDIFSYQLEDFEIEDYVSDGKIKAKLNN